MTPELTIGSPAPAFQSVDQNDNPISLSDFTGKRVVLYFYPKDDTPGCTKQACAFRDLYPDFLKSGAVVLGVSPDSAKSHAKFVEKFSLPFPLLADTGHSICEAYGVWVEKSMYGKTYLGVERSAFVIDAKGRLEAIHRKVKADTHPGELLQSLAEKS